jgi:drug/metabolite transporter (DMT)-like permease
MIAILGGLGTALLWATTLLGSQRASRQIGPWSTLAWVMLIGLVVAIPLILTTGVDVVLDGPAVLNLVVAGVANVAGLLLVYSALRRGKVAVVGPIVSTEGAIAATLAVLAGDPVSGAAIGVLALIAVGVVMAAIERRAEPADEVIPDGPPPVSAPVTAAMAIGGAFLFGINLFVTSRIAADLPIAWAILPARAAGVVGVTLPLLLTRRLRLTRSAVPFVVLVGLAEVGGVITFSLGARESAPITSVIASQFAALAAVSAFFLYGERLTRIQVAGVAIIALGVAILAALTA